MASVGLQVEEGLCLGVGDADGFGDAGVNDFFQRFPGFTERDILELYGSVFCVLPPCLSTDVISGLLYLNRSL